MGTECGCWHFCVAVWTAKGSTKFRQALLNPAQPGRHNVEK